jgi:hypothetical protein
VVGKDDSHVRIERSFLCELLIIKNCQIKESKRHADARGVCSNEGLFFKPSTLKKIVANGRIKAIRRSSYANILQ